MKSFLKDPYWQLTGLFILIKLSLHLFTFNNYELHRDEMLYFNQGDHPSFGNVSVPPFIGWVAFLVKTLFGYSVFGIRCIPMLLGCLSVMVMAITVKDFGGRRMALMLSCTAFVLSPGFLIFDSLFTVNVFEQFFWLGIACLFIKMMDTGNPKLWMWIGVTGGFAFLNKYLVIYLFTAFLIVLLFTPQRKLFLNKYFVYGCLAGLLIISPNIYWQYTHGWPVFLHISELEKSQLANMTLQHFLIDLFNLNSVSTFFWIAGCFAVIFLKSEKKYRFLGLVAFLLIALFMFSRGKAYYVLGIIPVLFALSGYILEKYFTKNLRFINFIILSLITLISCASVPLSLAWFSFENLEKYSTKTAGFVSYPFSRWEDGRIHPVSQVFSDMTGWKEMVALVHQAYQQIPETARKQATIYAERNYGYAGAVHFYGKPYRLPEAITFLDSYVLWAPDTIARGPVIYINQTIAGLDQWFDKCEEIGIVENKYFRENGLKVFLCQNPNNQFQEVYRQKANEEKNKYR